MHLFFFFSFHVDAGNSLNLGGILWRAFFFRLTTKKKILYALLSICPSLLLWKPAEIPDTCRSYGAKGAFVMALVSPTMWNCVLAPGFFFFLNLRLHEGNKNFCCKAVCVWGTNENGLPPEVPPPHTPFSFMLNITLTLVRGSFLPQMRRFKIKELKYPELICTTAKIWNPLTKLDVHYGKEWVGLWRRLENSF